MTDKSKKRHHDRLRRHRRVRKKMRGTAERPRLAVFRSNKHIYAQIINDIDGVTLAAASTMEKDLRGKMKHGGNIGAAKVVGQLVADRALAAGVTEVVFDRGPYIFHGRVKALADAARAGGLSF